MSPLEKINHPLFDENKLSVYIKRDDLIHPLISGNKWRKCHYLLKHIKDNGYKNVITFGGAYSNHIHAFSYACKELGINSIGIIRGEELSSKPLNKTLSFATENNMELIFVSRDEYKKRYEAEYIQMLSEKYNAYVVPEGGSTNFAVDGFADMLSEIRQVISFDKIFVPCGSGGTISGINANLKGSEIVYGVNVLKGTECDLEDIIKSYSPNKNYEILTNYHFGGYAKYNDTLINFIEWFEDYFHIEIEKVYSAKMFYSFFSMVNNGMLKDQNIILCHTGGLQGK